MLILHAALLDGRLAIWGEDSESRATDNTRVDGRSPGQHPRCADARRLAQTVGFAVEDCGVGPAIAWLPSRGNTPNPSSSMAGPVSRAKMRIKPWSVPSLRLDPDQAVELLQRCTNRNALTHGVAIGADLAYWSRALLFAASLTARQRFLPGVAERNGRTVAVWTPIFVGDDAHRLAELANLMPPPARAMTETETSEPPAIASQSVLREFITGIVDCMARSTRQSMEEDDNLRFDSTHDAWLHALSSRNPVVKGEQARLRQLRRQVADWQHPIAIAANSPYRICLRLEEPEEHDAEEEAAAIRQNRWRLRYLLQPHDDYSLLMNASDIWNRKVEEQRSELNLREFLLSSLAHASMICAPIAESLKTKEPAGCRLGDTEAYQFLSHQAAALQQAGFGVLLPAWWTRHGTKTKPGIRVKMKTPIMQGGSGMSMATLLELDVEVAIGDGRISPEELEALSELKVPLVRFRGQWVEIDAGAIKAAAEYWRNKKHLSLQEVLQVGLGADTRAEDDNLCLEADEGLQDMLDRLYQKGGIEELDAPEGFVGQLRPYQQLGYSWIAFLKRWGLGACLADDMGLGKTIQTLAALQLDYRQGNRFPSLLVCPTSVINNWQREAAKFTPELSVLLHHGPNRNRGADFRERAASHQMVITSYATMARDIKLLASVSWRSVILDEAQNIKNPVSKQASAAQTLRADHRIALTGTPVENHVGDLWSVMQFLNPGLLGSQAEFKRRYFQPIQVRKDEEAASHLQKVTGPFILRRLKTDRAIIDDLPDKHETKQYCNLTREQITLYEAVLREAETRLETATGIERRGSILDTLTKLKQVCNHPRQLLGDNSAINGRSGKLARLEELLDEIVISGDRVLVFSQFAEMGGILQQHIQETYGLETPFLHGGVTRKQRELMVDRFQDDPEGPLAFVLSLKAGGSGLNLPRANHVIHYDRWWNPAVENQATDRAFRIGQTKDVHVHKFICAGTLEDRIDLMIEAKQETAKQVVGATSERWLTELSNAELRDVLALSATASD